MKFVAWFVELIFMIRLALAPTLAGVLIGGYFYVTAVTTTRLICGIGIAVLGFIAGIVLVVRVKKKKTAAEFLSRINASPDLDNEAEKK